jgi:hypothetical protein
MSPNLRDQLQALHERLQQAQSVDADTRKILGELVGDISRLLERREPDMEMQRGVAERLEALAVRFEADHPTTSQALRRIVDTLANAGI